VRSPPVPYRRLLALGPHVGELFLFFSPSCVSPAACVRSCRRRNHPRHIPPALAADVAAWRGSPAAAATSSSARARWPTVQPSEPSLLHPPSAASHHGGPPARLTSARRLGPACPRLAWPSPTRAVPCPMLAFVGWASGPRRRTPPGDRPPRPSFPAAVLFVCAVVCFRGG
jgi:hypothetical protein